MAANLLLEITTKTDFASLQAFTGMLAGAIGKVQDFAKEQDRFVQLMKKGSMEVASTVDAASKSLIDTGLALQESYRLQNAEVKISKDGWEAVAKAAADMGKVTGDVDGAFRELTQGLISGSTEAFRKYGVIIKSTGDKHKDMDIVLKQLVEKYKDLNVEVETASEQMYVFNNNIGTLTGQIYGTAAQGLIPGLSKINDALGKMSGILAKPAGEAFFKSLSDQMFDFASGFSVIQQSFAWLSGVTTGTAQIGDFAAFLARSKAGKKAISEGRDAEYIAFINSLPGFRTPPPIRQPLDTKKKKAGKKEKDITSDLLAGPSAFESARASEADFFSEMFGEKRAERERAELNERIRKTQELAMVEAQLSAVTLQGTQKQLTLLQAEARSRFDMINQLGYDKDSIEYKKELLALREVEQQVLETQKQREIELWYEQANAVDMARLAFVEYVDQLDVGSEAARFAVSSITNTVDHMFNAFFNGTQGFWESLSMVVRNQAIAAAAQAFSIGLLQTVRASEWFSMPFGVGAAQGGIYTASAAEAFATSAVLTGIAAAASGVNKLAGAINGQRRSGGGGGGGAAAPATAQTSAGIRATTDQSSQAHYTIVLNGKAIYDSMVEEDRGRAMVGQRSMGRY